ncbi:MAG: hypothetical protein JW795_09845, partial [Chitinivibrionales bacterium]|nr:hypothetical protein [Chitinivibrionales bacterium]
MKIFNVVVILALLYGSYSSARTINYSTEGTLCIGQSLQTMVQDKKPDSLDMYVKRSSGFMKYVIDAEGGALLGNGKSGTTMILEAVGMHYDGVKGAKVTEVLGMFFRAAVKGSADNITMKVCKAGADSSSVSEIASVQKSVSTLDTTTTTTTKKWTSFPIANADTKGEPFLVVCDFKGADDKIGLFSNSPDKNEGKGEKRTRVKFNPEFEPNRTWAAAADIYKDTAKKTSFDADAMIIPVVEISTAQSCGMSIKNVSGIRSLVDNVAHSVTLHYNLEKSSLVSLRIFTLQGREMFVVKDMSQNAGEYCRVISCSD